MAVMLESELWVSFTSLLRSYFAVGSGEVPGASIQVSEQSVMLVSGQAMLAFECDSQSGAGKWSLQRGEDSVKNGRFTLTADGRIAVDGVTIELDHAAIDFVAELMQAGKDQ
jgi:hypothetical protein